MESRPEDPALPSFPALARSCSVVSRATMPKVTSKLRTHYRKEWEDLPECKGWLVPSSVTPGSSYCRFCKSKIRSHLADIRRHATGPRHQSYARARIFQQPVKEALQTPRFTADMKKKKLELRLALYTAVHNSITSIDPLTEILKDEFGCGTLDLKHTKTTQLIKKVLSPHFQEELKKDLKDSLYSIMVDEVTDTTITKLIGVSIKFFSPDSKDITSTFLQVLEIAEADASSLTAAVQKILDTWGLPMENFVGLATDGASVMRGEHHSLQANLRRKHPGLVHLWCLCHSLDLAARDATKTALPANLEYLIRESFNWFSHSALRQSQYKEIVELVGVSTLESDDEEAEVDENGNRKEGKVLKLLSPGRTRWLIIADCVERILSQYDSLSAHFSIAAEKERSFDARQLSSMYQREDTK